MKSIFPLINANNIFPFLTAVCYTKFSNCLEKITSSDPLAGMAYSSGP